MRHSLSQILSDAQVDRLEVRRKLLGLTRAGLLSRFEEALQREGCVHTLGAAKMRLDRVLNPRLRRPASEATLLALARTLDWTLPELESALELTEGHNGELALKHRFNGSGSRHVQPQRVKLLLP